MSWGLALIFASCALLSSVSASEDYGFDSCLRKDSISCVQIHIYRKLRALFSQDTINLLAGFQFVKNGVPGARSLTQEGKVDNLIYGVDNVGDRQSALEDYFYDKVSDSILIMFVRQTDIFRFSETRGCFIFGVSIFASAPVTNGTGRVSGSGMDNVRSFRLGSRALGQIKESLGLL